ncbi:hypothetical protein KP79_PYT06951 [Mizuhopecten yessoensis]|uniref:Uncharacterized protein n=1 Tax=Mizuhopecten yessoensis TaxID=6573 RepID=A0A210QJT1_MIZYE|nr:hypothetical protein KP79_PYT06951 [Mizuhopecten yessoensis]
MHIDRARSEFASLLPALLTIMDCHLAASMRTAWEFRQRFWMDIRLQPICDQCRKRATPDRQDCLAVSGQNPGQRYLGRGGAVHGAEIDAVIPISLHMPPVHKSHSVEAVKRAVLRAQGCDIVAVRCWVPRLDASEALVPFPEGDCPTSRTVTWSGFSNAWSLTLDG